MKKNRLIYYILLIFLLSFKSFYSQQESKTPNIVFYLSDDQDLLDYGVYGNPNVQTSNADLLASEGMKFSNFYTGQAICAPSRSQIFTGMYPVKNGCMANHIGVKPDIKSITSLLKESGYEVVLAGKSHVKPNKVFDWTHYFPKINNRYLPLEQIDDYLKNVNNNKEINSMSTTTNKISKRTYLIKDGPHKKKYPNVHDNNKKYPNTNDTKNICNQA